MKRITLLPVLLLTIAASGALLVVAQQDEDVRGAFMTTRPKPGEARKPTPKPTHRRPKPSPSPSSSSSPKPGSVGGATAGTTRKGPRMGLGLTLFMRDSNGLAVRIDPTHTFRKGDHVRFLLETNADGYLYIFNTTDGGPAVMVYPDQELDEAGNYIQAHVPVELPSSLSAEERLRWLTFDDHAGAEKLYFVFSREPLSDVPIEDDLVSLCRNDRSKCPWCPSAKTWTATQKEMSETIKSDRQGRMEGAETPAEQRGVTRGIGLNRDDPEPTLIMLSASTTKNILVAVFDLVHK